MTRLDEFLRLKLSSLSVDNFVGNSTEIVTKPATALVSGNAQKLLIC